MTFAEGLLIIGALSLIVFAVAEYEGSNLKVLNGKKLFIVCLIFFLGQMISIGLGYAITRIPLFAPHEDRTVLYAVTAGIIFLVLAAWVLYRTWTWKRSDEKLRELVYKRIAVEAVTAAIYTLLCGIGCGLLNMNIGATFLVVFLATILAVIIGLQCGYTQGDRFHRPVYAVSCALLAFTGIRILIRYL